MVGFGCGLGWLSVALTLLRSDNSPLETGKISIDNMSWIGSVISLGAIFGNCFFGLLVTMLGARHTIFMIGFPQLVSYGCVTYLAKHIFMFCPLFVQSILGELAILDIRDGAIAFDHLSVFEWHSCWRCSNLHLRVFGRDFRQRVI